jgi:hypothetical protein
MLLSAWIELNEKRMKWTFWVLGVMAVAYDLGGVDHHGWDNHLGILLDVTQHAVVRAGQPLHPTALQ